VRGARKLQQVTSKVFGQAGFNGAASSGGSTDTGTFTAQGSTNGRGSAQGMATSPFIETKTLAIGAVGGEGVTKSSVVPFTGVTPAATATGTVGGTVTLVSNTQFAAETGPINTGGAVLSSGSLITDTEAQGTGLMGSATGTGSVFGGGQAVGSTLNGNAGGTGAGALTGNSFATGGSNDVTSPFTGTGGVNVVFSNGGGASFGSGVGAKPTSNLITAASGVPAVRGPVAFSLTKDPVTLFSLVP
jgi:hypothetical protein